MNVLFMCNTKYTIFVSYILRKTSYLNDNAIMMVTDNILDNDFIEHIKSLGIWNEVVVVKEKNQQISYVEKQIQEIYNKWYFDNIHVFTVGKMSSHLTVSLSNKSSKIILTDGSIFTKMPVDIYYGWKNTTFSNGILPEGWIEFDFNRINEVQLFEPKMFDGSLNVPIIEIKLYDLWNNKDINMLKELNNVFKLTYDFSETQIVYCASYWAQDNLITYKYEEYFTKRLMSIIGDKKCIIKLHPHSNLKEQYSRFKEYQVDTFDYNDLPFEVIFLNMLYYCKDNFAIIMELSSIASNLMVIEAKLNVNKAKIIEMIEIEKEFNIYNVINNYLDNVYNFNKFYSNIKIDIPKTWSEFSYLINEESCWEQYSEKYKEEDLSFLKEDYINLLNENNVLKNNNPKTHKFKKYYDVMNEFLKIKNKGDSLNRFFTEKGINSIAIYGKGNIADRLIEDIEINVTSILMTEINEYSADNGFLNQTMSDFISNKNLYDITEAIVITPVFDENIIAEQIKQLGINKRILFIKDIIEFYKLDRIIT